VLAENLVLTSLSLFRNLRGVNQVCGVVLICRRTHPGGMQVTPRFSGPFSVRGEDGQRTCPSLTLLFIRLGFAL
jgi:hypothetical protein